MKKLRENQKYQRKPKKTKENQRKPKKTKENQKSLRENTKTNKVFKGFRRTLGYGFGLVLFFGFPECCFGFLKTFGKTNNTKENQRKPKKPSGNTQKQTKCLKVSDAPLDMGLVLFCCLAFPKVFRKQKNLRENQKNKENQKKNRENQTNKVFKGFRPTLGYGFGLVCFFGFPECFLRKPKKHSGKPKKQTRPNPYPRVRLKPLKTVFVWFSRRFFWLSLVFFGIFGFPEAFSRWSRCLGFRY